MGCPRTGGFVHLPTSEHCSSRVYWRVVEACLSVANHRALVLVLALALTTIAEQLQCITDLFSVGAAAACMGLNNGTTPPDHHNSPPPPLNAHPLFILLHSYIATLLHCYFATLTHWYITTMLLCYIDTLLHYHIATLLHYHMATLLLCYIATLPHCQIAICIIVQVSPKFTSSSTQCSCSLHGGEATLQHCHIATLQYDNIVLHCYIARMYLYHLLHMLHWCFPTRPNCELYIGDKWLVHTIQCMQPLRPLQQKSFSFSCNSKVLVAIVKF